MSMPTFPKNDPPLSREGSLNEIIASIAAEELSLSHILNTQGENLQYVLGTLPGLDEAASQDEVLRINQSVKDTLSGIIEQQMMLSSKLGAALKAPTIPGPAGPAGPTETIIYAQPFRQLFRQFRRAPFGCSLCILQYGGIGLHN